MLQKVIKIGNSAGVTISQALRKKLGINPGSEVIVEEGVGGSSINIRKKGSKAYSSSITPEFVEMVKRINKRYGPAFKELAKR